LFCVFGNTKLKLAKAMNLFVVMATCLIGNWKVPKTTAATPPFPRTILDKSGRGPFSLVPVNVLGTSLIEISLVHVSATHLSKVLHSPGSKEHPPEPPEEPRREAQASEHRHQADMASLELAGHRLGGAQRHQAGLLDCPAPATEVQGEAG